ncbi:hypothetical protein V6N11_077384 [Hibiscus sabdariffa]|uniref:Reverse transcriptase zinc-binding domain-containing protein n=1 Tax=Hibiscus sabdariffa TaxID=183260 RepID=A0ABR2TDA5_9ROSI
MVASRQTSWLSLHPYLLYLGALAGDPEIVLTNVERGRRRLTQDCNCTICDVIEEDLDHILRRCPSTLSLWSSLVKTNGWNEFLSLPMKDWLLANIVLPIKFVSDTLCWPLLFPYMLWNIWKRRNDKVVGADYKRQESVYVHSARMIEMGVMRGPSLHYADNN